MTFETPYEQERTRWAYPVPVVPGTPLPGPDLGRVTPQVAVAPLPRTSGTAVAAMVLGIVGAVAGWGALGMPCLVAIVLGHQGVTATRDGARDGRGMAVTGLVLGYLFVVPWVLFYYLGGLSAMREGITP
ncbi:DUF4190 domain-containing protein [Krasilnikovia sp. MM14-A1259]|uniref:DUF4190 domain-containing protein n=1 Tax=Krasilnikovia sp. MM14-A1259 TaxID=3373539 RepID=UPI00382E7D25